jgi:hypothetical protein
MTYPREEIMEVPMWKIKIFALFAVIACGGGAALAGSPLFPHRPRASSVHMRRRQKMRATLNLRYAAPLAAQQKIAPHGGAFANATGLAFIVLAITIIVIAGWRFVQTAKDINT